ncbi:MAG TPA: YbhB/YbcL family Raf kinase inhibitor-like protein [Dehalococcoidia bacterium]|nr:YbhB/YbcL family Raf kinase inhibitor-like protein [Dehalococcoidia bacterium]
MQNYGWRLMALAAFAMLVLAACGGDDDDDGGANGDDDGGDGPATISLTSEEFEDGGAIPEDFSCDGRNHSPPLRWGSRPGDAQSLAIIMDDLDADFVHWVLYDADPALGGLDFAGQTEVFPGGSAEHGLNSFDEFGYAGPCPPPGDEAHTYRFRLFVLNAMTDLEPGATADELEAAMQGHILAEGELTGTYAR